MVSILQIIYVPVPQTHRLELNGSGVDEYQDLSFNCSSHNGKHEMRQQILYSPSVGKCLAVALIR